MLLLCLVFFAWLGESFSSEAPAEENPTKLARSRIAFIHVGKTAGEAVGRFLRAQHVQFNSVHTRRVSQRTLRRAERVIISDRDPVERVISAFKWRHLDGGGPVNRFPQHAAFERALFGCFPSATSFAQSFLNGTGECARLANEAIRPSHSTHWNAPFHIAMGLTFYLERVLDILLTKPIFVTHLDARLPCELASLGTFLGVNITPTELRQVHAKYRRHDEKVTDKDATAALRRALRFEYEIQAKIERVRWRTPHCDKRLREAP